MSAFLDGELDRSHSAAVAAHLRDCWDCSVDAELIRMVKRSLHKVRDRQGDVLAAMRLRRFAVRLTN